MAGVIRALVAIDSTVDRAVVQAALPSSAEVEFVGIIDGLEQSWNALQEAPADLVVVACGGYADRALFFIEAALKQRPDRAIVVLASDAEDSFLRRVFEAGADDVVMLPETPDLVAFTLRKAIARRQGALIASGVALAPMIVVLGPKGGTGKTLTASNLAVALATMGKKVALVDLDLQFGDIGLALGLVPDKTIYDLAKSGGSLDIDKLESYLLTHPSGARILMAPTRPDHASFVSVELLRDVYTILRTHYEFVIVDTPPGFTPEVISSIDGSSDICLVAMLDSLSLKNTKLGLETLDLMGYDRGRVKILLNRADSRIGITHDDVAAIVGTFPDVFVPSEREIPISLTNGTPIVTANEKSDAAKAFRGLAETYSAAVSTNGAGADRSTEPPEAPTGRTPGQRRRPLLRRR